MHLNMCLYFYWVCTVIMNILCNVCTVLQKRLAGRCMSLYNRTLTVGERERWGGRCRKGPCACVLCDCVSVFVNGQVPDEYAYSHTHNSQTEPLQESLHVLKHLTHTYTHSYSLVSVCHSATCCSPVKERRSLHRRGRDLHKKRRRRTLLRMEG